MADAADSWKARAEKIIGGDLETLVARSADGLSIAPLHARCLPETPRPWRGRPAWAVAQRIDHPDAEAAGRHALAELEGGADALTLVFAGSPFARRFGLSADADLDLALEGIELDFIALRLDAGADVPKAAKALCALVERRTLTSAALAIDLGYDPIGLAARAGGAPQLGRLARPAPPGGVRRARRPAAPRRRTPLARGRCRRGTRARRRPRHGCRRPSQARGHGPVARRRQG